MQNVRSGWMGYAEIGEKKVRCTDFNVKLTQKVLFYDHTIGLRDSIPSEILGSKEDDGSFNEQKIFWRGSTKIVEGAINFPLTEFSANAFFQQACKGDEFDVLLVYSCDVAKLYKYCRVNTYSFTATAGEGANVSVGVMGIDIQEGIGGTYEILEKIITWDEITINGTGADKGIVSFDFAINNNCIPIYTAGTNLGVGGTAGGTSELLAHKIRIGMQEVTGSITLYNDYGDPNVFVEEASEKTIKISAGGIFNAELKVVFEYPGNTGQVSPHIRVIPFVGVAHAVT